MRFAARRRRAPPSPSPNARGASPVSPRPAPFNSAPAASRNCQAAERERAAADLREQAVTCLDSAGPSASPELRFLRGPQEVGGARLVCTRDSGLRAALAH